MTVKSEAVTNGEKELKTKWPVRAAPTAISAVSRSRISPTSIISGSCRNILRSAEEKVLPAAGLI